MVPRATYRVQFSQDFDLDQGAALAEYLQTLGVSHLYASPLLVARPGSTHGYDVVDPREFNPAIGGTGAFTRLSQALHRHGVQLLLDFIPNHMGVGGAENRLWLDVLAWGPDSTYADWFDIDWDMDGNGSSKVVLPLLGNQYGAELDAGALQLRFDEEEGTFAVWTYETHKLPICPRHYGRIWDAGDPELARISDAFAHLPPRHRAPDAAEALSRQLVELIRQNADAKRYVREAVARFHGRLLDNLIRRQHWRAAHYRVASDDINYRRFFNINELAGIRMENPAVFDYYHRRVLNLVRSGSIGGLRIDHIDGLSDPGGYLRNLRDAIQKEDSAPYVIVEKILARHESLREDWPVDGTTGYDFMAQATGLLLDRAAEQPLTRIYQAFTGDTQDFAATLRNAKLYIVENEMAGELRALSRAAVAIARQCPHTEDFTQNVLERALRQIVACYPVYRSYTGAYSEPAAGDLRDIDWAVEQARAHESAIDPSVFDFLRSLLTGDLTRGPHASFSYADVDRFLRRFQQYTSPVMAKGLEDTAFYRYPRLFALSEVGSRPDQFGITVGAFHRANAQRQKRWPNTLLAASTHDTKLGEDARARLAALTELPEDWERLVNVWTRLLRASIGGVEGDAPPDRRDEYLFYQLLIATWPLELALPAPADPGLLAAYTARVQAAMLKASREAKQHTSWVAPNSDYENALAAFVERALDPERSNAFLDSFRAFQQTAGDLGLHNSLSLTVLRLTSPGVPDIYQGSEVWNFSFMDPDNRRPVDFTEIQRLSNQPPRWEDGSIKLFVLRAILTFRARHPELFSQGDYLPVNTEGSRADHVIAFLRTHENQRILAVCSRLLSAIRAAGWEDTSLTIEDPPPAWTDLLSGRIVPGTRQPRLTDLLADLPAAVYVPADLRNP